MGTESGFHRLGEKISISLFFVWMNWKSRCWAMAITCCLMPSLLLWIRVLSWKRGHCASVWVSSSLARGSMAACRGGGGGGRDSAGIVPQTLIFQAPQPPYLQSFAPSHKPSVTLPHVTAASGRGVGVASNRAGLLLTPPLGEGNVNLHTTPGWPHLVNTYLFISWQTNTLRGGDAWHRWPALIVTPFRRGMWTD